MKSWKKFILVMFIVLLLSAILAPLLFKILPYKFERIFNRLVMIGTLGAMLAFIRIRSESFKAYGLIGGPSSFRYLCIGFGVAIVFLSVLVGLKINLGLAYWRPTDMYWLKLLWKVFYLTMTGLLIGVIEEFFFRGFIFKTLTDKFKWNLLLSVLLTSVFYAVLHFINYKKIFIGSEPTFFDSLKLITTPIHSFTFFPQFWHECLGLFFFGIVLNILVIHTKSLYPSIGLHAGCVFFIKLDGSFIDYLNKDVYWYSSDLMYDGFLGWIFLFLIGWTIRQIVSKGNKVLM